MIAILILIGICAICFGMIALLCCLANNDDEYQEYYEQNYECPQCKGWAVAYYQGKDKQGAIIRVECLDCGYYEDIIKPKKKEKEKDGTNKM